MASIGKIKANRKFVSCVSDGPIRDNVEYVEPFSLGKVEVIQFVHDDYDHHYWVNPDHKERIIELSKEYFELTGNSMSAPIPTTPEYITKERIEDAYIMSLFFDIRCLGVWEKEFKKAIKEGYGAVGFEGAAIARKYKGTDKDEISKAMTAAHISPRWQFFSLSDFTILPDFDWQKK